MEGDGGEEEQGCATDVIMRTGGGTISKSIPGAVYLPQANTVVGRARPGFGGQNPK